MSDPRALMTAPARLGLRILGDDDLARVHEAALELLGAAGAAAQAAAEAAPATVTLCGRVPEHDVVLGDGTCRLAAGALTLAAGAPALGTATGGGEPRPAAPADLAAACTLADALPEVGLVVGPPLRTAKESAVAAARRALGATTKHVLVCGLTGEAEGQALVALATALAGSPGDAWRRPPVSLAAGPAGEAAALAAARAGLPVALVLAPAGTAADGDLAGALVRYHAGVLAGCAAVRAAGSYAPFVYAADPALAGLAPASPAAAMFELAAAQLAARLGLPFVAAGMVTTSPVPDWQACTQNAFASMGTTTAGAAVTAGAGTLAAGEVFSPQQLVMDTEIYSWNAKMAAGIEVDEETIALETIKQVGISGNYLSQRHTRRHMKDVWRPRLLDRTMWDAWIASGKEGAAEKASALADSLLAGHEPLPLGDELAGELDRIIAEAGL